MRTLPERSAPPTPGELAQRERVARLARAWNALDLNAIQAWRAYAKGLASDASGPRRSGLSAYNAFSSLASKCLQLRPQGAIPSLPPAGPFFGDAVAITVGGGAGVSFSANQPNAPGVVTELLLQPLASAGRTPRPKAYVSEAFVGFGAGHLTRTLDVAPGWYACAYRFIRSESGQETALATCGIVRVG